MQNVEPLLELEMQEDDEQGRFEKAVDYQTSALSTLLVSSPKSSRAGDRSSSSTIDAEGSIISARPSLKKARTNLKASPNDVSDEVTLATVPEDQSLKIGPTMEVLASRFPSYKHWLLTIREALSQGQAQGANPGNTFISELSAVHDLETLREVWEKCLGFLNSNITDELFGDMIGRITKVFNTVISGSFAVAHEHPETDAYDERGKFIADDPMMKMIASIYFA